MSKYLDFYEGKIILVTGGAGAIGSNLCRRMTDLKTKLIIILDNLSSSYEWNIPSKQNILFIKGSVTDDICLKRAFNENPSIVFHLAAFFANQNSVDYPERDLEVNGLGTLKVLEYSNLAKVERFIYASSGCSIYGNESPLPLREEFMSMHLTTPYQITKMVGELYCNFFANHYNLKVVKTRFFNSYGPGEVPGQYRNVIPNFIYWAMKKLPLPITGNINATRDFTYVEDLVDGLLRAGYYEKAVGEEINLASAREIKIGELAQMINDLTNNKRGIKVVGKRVWDTKDRLLASIDKAKELLRYEPKMSFEQGLKNTIKWFKQNWENIDRSASFPPGVSSSVREQIRER
ncbi:MAG TPA: nucleotide sugar epimerase [Elusimicrobia bacterium]|jgi:nucleoside-diphosphate-sugar epimerase|nr:nucleotide sugar epimerase [Elusimicrobiota bacterium]